MNYFTYWTYALSLPVRHGHRLLDFIQLCLELSPPSSSSCTWNLPNTFPSQNLSSKCSWVALFLYSLVVSTVVLACQHCHQISWLCVQATSTFFWWMATLIHVSVFEWHVVEMCLLSGGSSGSLPWWCRHVEQSLQVQALGDRSLPWCWGSRQAVTIVVLIRDENYGTIQWCYANTSLWFLWKSAI